MFGSILDADKDDSLDSDLDLDQDDDGSDLFYVLLNVKIFYQNSCETKRKYI